MADLEKVEKAIKIASRDKRFYQGQIKELEDSPPMSAEKAYTSGYYKALSECRASVDAYDFILSVLKRMEAPNE